MGVRERPAVFQTSDGREFGTKDEADRNQAAIDAAKKYDDALRALGVAIADVQLTADGKPFDMYERHYYLDEYLGEPCLLDVTLGRWFEQRLSLGDDGALVIHAYDRSRKERTFVSSELYASRTAAVAALVAAIDRQMSRLSEQKQRLTKPE